MPIITEQEVLYYRKDLLTKSRLHRTAQDPRRAQGAAKIEADNPGVAGFVARTGKAAAVTQFSSFLFSFGGDFVDASGKATVNTAQAKQAYAYYGGLLKDHGPENISTDMSWSEAMAIFTQGKAAFYTEANSLYKNATDPAKSKVSDTVGFAAFPAGPAGSKPYNIPSWALGMNEARRTRTTPGSSSSGRPARSRRWRSRRPAYPAPVPRSGPNPEGTATYPKDLAEAIAVSTTNGVGHDRPLVVKVPRRGRSSASRSSTRSPARTGRRGGRGERGVPEVPRRRSEVTASAPAGRGAERSPGPAARRDGGPMPPARPALTSPPLLSRTMRIDHSPSARPAAVRRQGVARPVT